MTIKLRLVWAIERLERVWVQHGDSFVASSYENAKKRLDAIDDKTRFYRLLLLTPCPVAPKKPVQFMQLRPCETNTEYDCLDDENALALYRNVCAKYSSVTIEDFLDRLEYDDYCFEISVPFDVANPKYAKQLRAFNKAKSAHANEMDKYDDALIKFTAKKLLWDQANTLLRAANGKMEHAIARARRFAQYQLLRKEFE